MLRLALLLSQTISVLPLTQASSSMEDTINHGQEVLEATLDLEESVVTDNSNGNID